MRYERTGIWITKFPSKVAVHPAGAWITVTSLGLPVAPDAVTRIVPVRADVLVLAVKLQLMVPELVPLVPDVIVSQLLAGVTAADHGMVPSPVLATLNTVVPDETLTFWFEGITEREAVPSPAYQTS